MIIEGKRTSYVKNYQTEFERLANRITGLSQQCYLSCFISGLKPELSREVQAFQPTSLPHAICLAKVQEDKVNDRFPKTLPTPNIPTAGPSRSPIRPTLTSTPLKPPTNRPTTIKRLTPDELQAHRDQGLCYNCDERFHVGHRSKRLFHLLIAAPDPEPDIPDDETLTQLLMASPAPLQPDPPTTPNTDKAQISLHTLMGHPIPQTLRVHGSINKHPVSILIYSGSTHNFIQD